MRKSPQNKLIAAVCLLPSLFLDDLSCESFMQKPKIGFATLIKIKEGHKYLLKWSTMF